MILYAYDRWGWYQGEAEEGAASATSEPPPSLNTADTPGEPRARWRGFAWALEPYPEPPAAPTAYAFDAQGWFAAEVAVGTPDSTRARPDLLSVSTTPGDPRARWQAGAWIVQAFAPLPRHITTLAFRQRFSRAERIAIELAALDNPAASTAQRQASASLRSDLKDQAQARYIDLDRADTRDGVQALETAGLLAPGRALQILNAPVQTEERPPT